MDYSDNCDFKLDYADRILGSELQARVISPEEAVRFIQSGMTVALSGFSKGHPKLIPVAMARDKSLSKLTVLQAAGKGSEVLGELGRSESISRYFAFQWGGDMRNAINSGRISHADTHFWRLPQDIRNGIYGKIDVAVIECAKIYADGSIVPSLSVGVSQELLDSADKVLLELNVSISDKIEGLHDVVQAYKKPLECVNQHVGAPVLRCQPDKICGIVISGCAEEDMKFSEPSELFRSIANNVVKVLSNEIQNGRLDPHFTFQAGSGDVTNAVLAGLQEGGFTELKLYSGVLSDGVLRFIKSGLVTQASSAVLELSHSAMKEFFDDIEFYKQHIVVRPIEMTSSAMQITALDMVSMNTAVEADIYGNINSSSVMGTKILNGIGGANDFSRNARLSIFITPSLAKGENISCIVPMVSHVDNTEHDVGIIVTEWGFADLRGKPPKERAEAIINNCCHPVYRQQLLDYFKNACELCGNSHMPHDLTTALSWHKRYLDTGSMKEFSAN